MAEFRIEPQQASWASWSKTLLIAVAVLVVLLGGIAFYVRRHSPEPRQSAAVVIPDVLRAGNTDFEYYKNKIRIDDVKASLGLSYNNSRVAMIAGTVLNDGDRKLEALELHVALYDVWDKLSKEKTAFAVRPGVGFNLKPMEPLEKRTFNIAIEGVEYYWNPKRVELEITGLKYH
ncbi:MAG: hypothetical protein LBP68_02455 [Acidobacteriota bacterium]|jgi:hypothetical protein|nr:hypothetical protein [Acidobacteriota bacterium]